MKMRTAFAGFAAAALLAPLQAAPSPLPTVRFVDGLASPEDLVPIPDSPWIVASGLGGAGTAGGLFVLDRRTNTASPLRFVSGPADERASQDCPGAPQPSALSAHGLALRKQVGGHHVLYVVNHGEREAVETFTLDASANTPRLVWTGCIPLPQGVVANAVAPLPDGSIVVSHMLVPRYFGAGQAVTDMQAWIRKFAANEPTGHVARWSRADGWSELAGTAASGPNGVETSADGRWVWVANWPAGEVVRVANGSRAERRVIKLGFHPDNLRWGDDGWLWAAGATGDPTSYFACWIKPNCRNEYKVARIDPGTLRVEPVSLAATPGFGDVTTALSFGGEVWLGSHPSERVAVVPLSAPKR